MEVFKLMDAFLFFFVRRKVKPTSQNKIRRTLKEVGFLPLITLTGGAVIIV